MSEWREERAELAEDEEKLESALREYDNEWSEEEEDDDEEDCLLIDLENPVTNSDVTGRSISPSIAGSGSQINGQEVDNAGSPSAPALPQSSSKEAEISEAEKALALNRALQGILEKHMEDVRLALEENKQKQQMLEDGSWADDSARKRKGRTFGPFRTPFFQNGMSFPPVNEDVKLKKGLGELSYEDMHESITFKRTSRANLREGIVENLQEERLRPLMTRLDSEVRKGKDLEMRIEEIEGSISLANAQLKQCHSKKRPQRTATVEKAPDKTSEKKLMREIKQLEQALDQKQRQKKDQSEILAAIEDEMERLKQSDCSSFLESLNVEIVDWMKISKMRFGEKTSWLHCRKEWEHVMNPSLNHGQWSKSEEQKLVELVKRYPSGNWDVIAKELGTDRTPFMCLNHYQRTLNPEFRSRPWTEEEDERLKEVTRNMRENANVFSWRKVSALVDSRSWTECSNRMCRLDERMNHGRWTKEEDARLLAAIEILGPCWTKIACYMRHRTPVQIRDRYVHCLDPSLNFSFFTYDEDVKLLKMYKKGLTWTNMLKGFEGRTDSMLFNRFKTLKGWQKELDWWNSQTEETKKMLLGKSLFPPDRKSEEQRLKKYYSKRLGISEDDYNRQRLDIANGVDPDLIPPRPPMHMMYNRCSPFRRANTLESWTNKLTFHACLKDKLKHMIAKEQLKLHRPNDKKKQVEETDEEKRVIQRVINLTADETLQGFRPISRQKYSDMYHALNRYFLGESKIRVKDFIQACKPEKKRYQRKRPGVAVHVNAGLNAILRNNNRSVSQRGRDRKLLPRDGRCVEKIQTEFEEVKRSIDVLLFECLGPGFLQFCHAVKHRNLDVVEELLSIPCFKDDEQYQKGVSTIEHRMAEVSNHPFLKPFERERDLSRLRKSLKKLQVMVQRHYDEKRSKLNCVLEEMCRDVNYIDNLKERQSELTKEFLSHLSGNDDCSKAARQLIASPTPSSVLMPHNPQSGNNTPCQEDSMEVEARNSRTASLRKRKQVQEHPEAPWKKLRCKSLEEVNKERRKLPLFKVRQMSDIRLLPPTLCTLSALRALLLNRQELLKQAGDLYKVENYHKNPSRQSGNPDAVECVETSSSSREKVETASVAENSSTADSVVGVDSCINQPDREMLPNGADTSTSSPAVTPSSLQKVEPVTQQSESLPLTAVKAPENTLGLKVMRIIPARRESAYEVSIGISAPTRCFKHMAQTDCEKLPEDEMAPTPSPAVVKALQIPKITHKVYIPQCVDPPTASGKGSKNKPPAAGGSSNKPAERKSQTVDRSRDGSEMDYETELRAQMKVAADFAMTKYMRRQKTLSTDNVVVVGVDPVTKDIVHFKSQAGSEELMQIEARPTFPKAMEVKKVSDSAPPSSSSDLTEVEDILNLPDKQMDANIIHAIRQTVEYKTFAARMRSLFMWPVLLSTLTPPQVPRLTAEEKAARPKRIEKGKRRYLTKDGRKDMKQKRKEKREAIARAKREAEAAGKEFNIKMRKPRSARPKLPPEPKSGRPVRKVRLKPEVVKTVEERPSHSSRTVPTWWKEAILEAMVTKQAIERGEVARDEKNLSEDEDFQDKGDYEDDQEWLAPLLEQEEKEKEAVRREEEAERERREREKEEENGGKEACEEESVEAEVEETEDGNSDK